MFLLAIIGNFYTIYSDLNDITSITILQNNSADMSRLQAFLQRADKLGYFTDEYAISSLC